jgi:hypothetical protein
MNDFGTQFIRIFSGSTDLTQRRQAVDIDYITTATRQHERERADRQLARVKSARLAWEQADLQARAAKLAYIEAIAAYDVSILDGRG